MKDAIPAEAPKGSVIVWHGATWHGAFPRKDKGLRLGLAVYHRHAATLPQEDVRPGTPPTRWCGIATIRTFIASSPG